MEKMVFAKPAYQASRLRERKTRELQSLWFWASMIDFFAFDLKADK